MSKLKSFGSFWYHFIIGDDWKIAFGVGCGLGLSAILVHIFHITAWWILPILVILSLTLSLVVTVRQKK